MKRYRRFLSIGLVAAILLLTGCGNSLYELTAAEEALIVKYAAHFVAKHNIYQKDGISVEVAEEESEESEETETQEPDDTQEPGPADEIETLSIAEAMNLPTGIALAYKESFIADHIKEGTAYSEEAGVGFAFYVLKFQMKNDTGNAIKIDNFSKDIVFQLTSGSIVTKSKGYPFLSSELSAYVGTVEAGATVDVILLFKVKEADAEKITNPTLELVDKETTKPVKL